MVALNHEVVCCVAVTNETATKSTSLLNQFLQMVISDLEYFQVSVKLNRSIMHYYY